MYFGWLHKKTPENWRLIVLKKSYLGRFRVLEFLSTTRNDRVFLFPRAFLEIYIGINSCILVDHVRKNPDIAISMTLRKVFWFGFEFSNFFRLLETTEFFFFLGLLKRLISAWTYVFWFITQENTQKLQYESPQKKFIGSVSNSRIFFDYSKRPNFSFS